MKGVATRERILTCAAEIILADGLVGLSLDKVRLRAEVSGSQLTHYFDGKQSLIRAVLDRQMNLVMSIHETPSLGNLETWEEWENWVEVNVRSLRRFGYCGRPTYHGLAGQLAKSDDSTRAAVARGYRRWVQFFEDRLSRMKAEGVLVSTADPSRLALVVVAAHQGGCLVSFTHRRAWPLASTLRFIVNYLRMFASDPTERAPGRFRQPWEPRGPRAARAHPAEPRLTRKGLATRGRIVEGAAELMFERGVRNTSLDDVRKSVGVSGSQLSHYFVDKRDLALQVIAVRSAGVQDCLSRVEFGALATMHDLRAWRDDCIGEARTVYLAGGCPYGSLAAELLDSDGALVDALVDGYDEWLQRLRDGLTSMVRRGELSAEANVRHLAVSLLTAHQGGATLSHAMGSVEPATVLLVAAVDYVTSFQKPAGAAVSAPAAE
ncbi:TetR family transcriptional regulator (plasmid) [Mycolicibacterium arabiense]|uniref:TetR family transcriptional regulator n=1 Tax=Mycolicibacterium arabiense TaxID=1286181 RepID=A0A7I7RQC0_9MYCO|nr:TetR family transcriptional regulator [Mycolicibacterium arabiense]